MADLFHILNDAQIVLRAKGVFYQRKLYKRGDRLYAGHGGGFIRIGGGDSTSCPGISWESIDAPGHLFGVGQLGAPTYTGKCQ